MLIAAIFIFAVLVLYGVSQIDTFIDGLDGQYGGCNHNCDEGHKCTCGERP